MMRRKVRRLGSNPSFHRDRHRLQNPVRSQLFHFGTCEMADAVQPQQRNLYQTKFAHLDDSTE